jgi:hypothetical protein
MRSPAGTIAWRRPIASEFGSKNVAVDRLYRLGALADSHVYQMARHRHHDHRRVDHLLGRVVHYPVRLLRPLLLLLVLQLPQVLR